MICPACLETIHNPIPFIFEEATEAIRVRGVLVARVTRMEARVLGALYDASGRVVNKDHIRDRMHIHDADKPTFSTVHEHIGNLRRKLADTPVMIVTVVDEGYSLAKRPTADDWEIVAGRRSDDR